MTISSDISKIIHTTNETVTRYSFPFKIFKSDQLRAILTTDSGPGKTLELLLETDYKIANDSLGHDNGGFIDMTETGKTKAGTGYRLTIMRSMGFVQETDYRPHDLFPADSHEMALDILTMQDQQLREEVARAIKAPPDSDGALDIQDFINLANKAEEAAADAQYWASQAQGIVGDSQIIATGTNTPRTISDRFAYTLDIRDFGAVPDFDPSTKTGTDNHLAIQRAIYHCAGFGKKLIIAGGDYGVWSNGSKRMLSNKPESIMNNKILGGFDIPSNTVIEWDDDSILYQMTPSYSGAFLSNVNRPIMIDGTFTSLDWSTNNVTLINPRIDGSLMELFDQTLAHDTFEPWNDNAIGWGGHVRTGNEDIFDKATNITIIGGMIKGYRAINGGGGKGVAVERGVENLFVSGTKIENCTIATGVVFENRDSRKNSKNIVFNNIVVERCGMMLFCYGQDVATGGAGGDVTAASVVWRGSGYCVGHHPEMSSLKSTYYRRHRKAAPFALNAADNVNIEATIFNPIDFPSRQNPCGGTRYPDRYPTLYINQVEGTDQYYESYLLGAGLSGPIGAALGGWGRNVKVDIDYKGTCDDLWAIAPIITAGNSLRPTAAQNMQIKINGEQAKTFFRNDLVLPTVTISSIASDRKSFTFGAHAYAPDRDNDLLGDVITIAGINYRCVGYTAASRTINLETPLEVSALIGTAVAWSTWLRAVDAELSGELTGYCQVISQYLFAPWTSSLTRMLCDVSTFTGPKLGRFKAAIGQWAYNRGSYIVNMSASADSATVNQALYNADIENLKSSRTGTLNVQNGISVDGAIVPLTDAVYSCGAASNRWTNVYAANGTIQTSDLTAKQNISPIPDAVLKAWGKVKWQRFKFVDAVAEKGSAARWHTGLIAQHIKEVFETEGLNAFDYGVLCYDTWPALPEQALDEMTLRSAATFDQDGYMLTPEIYENKKTVTTPGRESGERYGVRYDEAMAIESAYLRWVLEGRTATWMF
jgi:hypothetical protein